MAAESEAETSGEMGEAKPATSVSTEALGPGEAKEEAEPAHPVETAADGMADRATGRLTAVTLDGTLDGTAVGTTQGAAGGEADGAERLTEGTSNGLASGTAGSKAETAPPGSAPATATKWMSAGLGRTAENRSAGFAPATKAVPAITAITAVALAVSLGARLISAATKTLAFCRQQREPSRICSRKPLPQMSLVDS